MKPADWGKLVISLVIPQIAGWLGALFTMQSVGTWYAVLVRPALTPPPWIFAPVWTVLYLLIGISFFIVWKRNFQIRNPLLAGDDRAWNPWTRELWNGNWQKFNIVAVFLVQLFLNVLWSYVFFGLRQPGWAFFELLALFVSIIYVMINFYRVSKSAAILLLPYILWVTFAGYLNLGIWLLN